MKDAAGRYIRYVLIALGVVLLLLVVFLVANYLSLRRAQIISAREMRLSELFASHAPLPVSGADIIRSWMTFDYINKLFDLPPEYLQTQLQIMNTHYPRLTISSYVKSENLDATTFLVEVENAVRNYTAAPANAAPASNATSTNTTDAPTPSQTI